jgi:ABC-type branched-subunit amino acid transport system substrate-binding protein
MKVKNAWWCLWWRIMMTAGFASSVSAADVVVGALNDMTGATSDVGKDYALGIAEAINYCNDTGGINGKPIKLISSTTATGCRRP